MLLLFAYICDLILGDPEKFPHPIRWIGNLIIFFEKRLRNNNKNTEKIRGVFLTIFVIGISSLLTYLVLYFSKKINPLFENIVWIYIAYICISIKDLRVKSMDIYNALKTDIKQVRVRLSKIVGRDTENLSEEKIIMATIESIAESTNDGIIAPIFYLMIGGPVLAIAYKSINTLDSMVGYKNEKYIRFGWFSAKIDDIFNFIPARITGFLICIASFFLYKDLKTPFRIMLRDGKKHTSPNSGISESAMAGALKIRLGGPSLYNGKEVKKPFIGDELEKINRTKIIDSLNISLVVSILIVLFNLLIKWKI
jgi:adenosylcobinamide-phosphate synthase